MEVNLPNIVVRGLGFALLNLLLTVQKHLRDADTPKPIKIAVIVGTVILLSYALVIGVFAAFLLFDGAETTTVETSRSVAAAITGRA